MNPEELIRNYPVLHHMADYGSWPRIQQLGLRTTTQLVDACAPSPRTRAAILNQPRRQSYELDHPIVGAVTVRDQKPLALHNLRLTDVTLEGFLELLNDRVFMWATPERLTRLLSAKHYRQSVHDVLVLDTASIVEDYANSIRLTEMNTGATIFPNAPPRGFESFMSIDEFPYVGRRRGRSPKGAIVELCIINGVDNVEQYVTRVERRRGTEVIDVVYEG